MGKAVPHRLAALCVLIAVSLFGSASASAQSAPVFQLGFKAIADQLGSVVGVPAENEHFEVSTGNSLQQTTTGLMVWRKSDNWTAFTDGSTTWVNGPYGIQSRPNSVRFPWENDLTPSVATQLPAVSIPGATMVYYDVQGQTAADLRAQMSALGPVDSGGQRWDSETHWLVSWSWSGRTNRNGTCQVVNPAVNLDVKVTFPRWSPPPGTPRDLIDRWTAYTAALATHESGHVRIAQQNVGAISGLMTSASCSNVDSAARSGLASLDQQEAQYEAATAHGREQGAIFP